jgi:putative peptidoglycan binding protein/FecR-like protein
MNNQSFITWSEGHLEIRGKRYLHIFEKKHFFRIFLTFLLITISASYLVVYHLNDHVDVVWQNGGVFRRDDQSNQWQKQRKDRFVSSSTLKLGAPDTVKKETDNKFSPANIIGAVLKYHDSVTAVLTEESVINRLQSTGDTISFKLEGIIYIHIPMITGSKAQSVVINGIQMESSGGTLMHYVEKDEAKISLLAGELLILPGQRSLVQIPEAQKFKSGKADLAIDQAIVFKDDYISIEKATDFAEATRRISYLPGFEKDGPYVPMGSALIKEDGYQLIRNGETYDVKERVIPVMFGDKIVNSSSVPLVIETKYGDQIRLYPLSEFKIPDSDNGKVQLPLLMTLYAESKISNNENSFLVKGRLRIKINKKFKRRVSFKSAVAMIIIKGTDFEINSGDKDTEALVVSGIVGMSDLDNRKSIDIKRGYMSSIGKDGLPSEAVVIPPDRFKELLRESFAEEKPILLSKNIDLNRLSLKKGTSLVFQWDKPIQSANIIVNSKVYPLAVDKEGNNTVLERSVLHDLVAGKYAARIEAKDQQNNWGETDISFSLLPEKSLNFLCNSDSTKFNKRETDAIKAFQKETRIKVDGIIGPETRRKIQEMLNCEAN